MQVPAESAGSGAVEGDRACRSAARANAVGQVVAPACCVAEVLDGAELTAFPASERDPSPLSPCCPDGCHHCARSCCSRAQMILVAPGSFVAEPLLIGTFHFHSLPRASVDSERVFHPPRS